MPTPVSSPFPPPPTLPEEFRVPPQYASKIKADVQRMLQRDSSRFPGAQPISFAARHLDELQRNDYFVCEKSDGLRCLMFLTADAEGNEQTFLIDRRNDMYAVQGLHFPLPDSEQSFYRDTIVDGELVNDRTTDGGTAMKYLVFDCLALSGRLLVQRPLDKRLAYFREKVYNPHAELYRKYPEERQYRPFEVEFKGMHRSYGIEEIFRTILPKLQHGSDGLIFTCRTTPYKFGTDPHILKWKPAEENSVDFRVRLDFPLCDVDQIDESRGITTPYPDWSAMPTIYLYCVADRGEHVNYGTLHLEPEDWERIKDENAPLDHRIFECYQDRQHRWRFMRFRDDKAAPNHISTVESVIESITDRVEEKDLIAAQQAIRTGWKDREAEAAKSNGRAPSRG